MNHRIGGKQKSERSTDDNDIDAGDVVSEVNEKQT